MDGSSGPLVSGDDCCEAIIEVGDQPNHLWRSMVVGQRERDKVMMNTAKRVGQVQPADTERLTSLLSLPEDGKELRVMLQTARHAINEGLLGGCVQEVVAHHELFTRLVKTLLTHDVRAMGRKWDGLVESSVAFFLLSRCTMPTFHAEGMMAWVVQQQLNMCSSAGNKEGHLLMMA